MRAAFDAIRRRPARSLLTALGIGLATALVVVLLAASAGIQASATQLAAESGVDLLAASENTSLNSSGFPNIPLAHRLTSEIPANDSNVATASPWLLYSPVYGNASMWAAANESAGGSAIPAGWTLDGYETIGWIPSENVGIEVPVVTDGPGFSYSGDPHYANGTYAGPPTQEIVLDQGLAGVLHVRPGQLVWMSSASAASPADVQGWYENATAFRVVGISGPFWLIPSALIGFTYLSELQAVSGSASGSTDYASLILIHLHDGSSADIDRDRIATAFPGLTVFTLASILGAVEEAVNLYRTFGDIIAILSIVVAALFATTVLLMSVDDRTREIALRRALGYSRGIVGGMVVEESLYLALMGVAIGLPVAYAGSLALNEILTRLVSGLPAGFSFISFDAGVIATAILLVVAIGLLASIAPAVRAMQLPLAQELRAP